MSNITRLFCDDLCVLEKLYPNGIDAHMEVITDSPAIHSAMKAVSTNDRVSPQRLIELTADIYQTCTWLYETLKSHGFEYDSYPLMFALTVEQNFLRKAMSLQNSDFECPVIVAELTTEKGAPRYKNILSSLFANHPQCEFKKVSLSDLDIVDHYNFIHKKKGNRLIEFTNAFLSNVYIYPLVTPLWPILKRVSPKLEFLNVEGIGLIEENQTIRSICVDLSLRGRRFKHVKESFLSYHKKHSSQFENEANVRYGEIEKIIEEKMKEFVARNTESKVFTSAFLYLSQKMKIAHTQYYTSYKCSADFINLEMKGIRGVLSNMLKNPVEYGFAVACRDKDIKLFTFQHGICREISPHFDYCPQITESNLPHVFITNTKKAAEVSKGYPFTKAQTIPIGITKDHYGGKKYQKHKDFPDIFYISTNVYSSDTGFIKAGADDRMSCESELATIRDILSPVNKDILYKTYPTQKYLDSDPCYAEVKKHPNIILYQENKDLRYISKHARVLVTGKATSTFNWCFLTGKPLVFLDHPYLAPLRRELVPVFKDMLFYFDLTSPETAGEIVALLNQPVEKIDALYNAADKKAARERFINEYYFDIEYGAEKRAYKIVSEVFKTSVK